jgi:hypothetical protein
VGHFEGSIKSLECSFLLAGRPVCNLPACQSPLPPMD